MQIPAWFSPCRHSREGGNPVLASLARLNVQLDTRLRGYDDGFLHSFLKKLAVDLSLYFDAIALGAVRCKPETRDRIARAIATTSPAQVVHFSRSLRNKARALPKLHTKKRGFM
jgi:hypothetical protein